MGREADGRRQGVDLTPLHWLLFALAIATAGIHLYVGLTTGRSALLVLGAGLLAGLLLFFTRWFDPVLYLVGAIYVGVLLTVWLLADARLGGLALLDKAVQVALLAVFVTLFVRGDSGTGEPDDA